MTLVPLTLYCLWLQGIFLIHDAAAVHKSEYRKNLWDFFLFQRLKTSYLGDATTTKAPSIPPAFRVVTVYPWKIYDAALRIRISRAFKPTVITFKWSIEEKYAQIWSTRESDIFVLAQNLWIAPRIYKFVIAI